MIGIQVIEISDFNQPDSSRRFAVTQSLVLLRRWLLSVVLVCLISLGLSSCSLGDQPPRGVILSALGQQIQLTQSAIAQSLDLEASGVPEVTRVRLEEQESLSIGDQKGVHLVGRFDWRLPGDAVKVDSPFELFLERGERGQSWRLALPSGSDDGSSQTWITYPLAIDPA
ncbi:hypothetical protein [Synechococcus sp. UW179A]|uniref:hypothetical protein n=1 Tax=Synechococcus sp. UW179A TaxID=2575510 RepID=UPI001FCBD482|nr:hypothetical protein [Synechococcus sp. UW179A]